MSERDYEVGYCRPPKHTQYIKGQSGNPKNKRKPVSQTFARLIDSALERRIWVREGNDRKRMAVIDAIIGQVAAAAAGGDGEAFDLLMQLHTFDKKHGKRGQHIITEITMDDGTIVRRDSWDDSSAT
jgi:hypothetical protein